jgi:hypothetical protein
VAVFAMAAVKEVGMVAVHYVVTAAAKVFAMALVATFWVPISNRLCRVAPNL